MRQTPLASIMGKFDKRTPYKNQKKIPRVMIKYIPNEMLSVSPVLMTFRAWGNWAIAVQKPAMYPIITISNVISVIFCKSSKKIRPAQNWAVCAIQFKPYKHTIQRF